MDIERLERKLARAVRDGRGARVEELSARLAAAKAVAKAARRAAKRAAAAASTEAVGAAVKASEGSDGEIEQRSARRAARRAEKERVAAAAAAAAAIAPSAAGAPLPAPGEPAPPAPGMVLAKNGKWYPAPVPPPPGNVTLLLFYAYVVPPWTRPERSAAADFARATLARLGCTGRLRVALEGFNATLTGPAEGIRGFTAALREFSPRHFGATDFKYVDGLQDNKAFRELKVMPVDELVTYGFKASEAPLEYGGRHVKPEDWTRLAAQPDTVMIDVRNANETAIGRFAPPPQGAQLLDPHMRRSTEFPEWVDSMLPALKEKKTVMMYCTAGVRCERASALLVQKGVPREAIVQLEGGIHRYLEAYPEDGGIWAGKNYTFDKRFSHGAEKPSAPVGKCAGCDTPWERYQSGEKCGGCKMEMLVCRDCQRAGVPAKRLLLCWLCAEAAAAAPGSAAARAAQAKARAFAAAGGGRDGEGEGRAAAAAAEEGGGGGAGRKRGRE